MKSGTIGFALLLVLACGLKPLMETDRSDATTRNVSPDVSALPWVTIYRQRGNAVEYDINYLTDRAGETVIATSPDAQKLKAFMDSAEVKRNEKGALLDFQAPEGVRIIHYKGKGPGKTDQYGKIAYRSTLHRRPVKVPVGGVLHYAVFNGEQFAGPFTIRAPHKNHIKAFHVGHTSSIYRWKKDVVEYFPAPFIEQMSRGEPHLLLHSGDFMISPYNVEELKRETLGTFGTALGSLPLLVSASNHDQGWPQAYFGEGWLFRHLLRYRYYERTLNHYCDLGPFRFIMLDYVEMKAADRLPGVMKMLVKWMNSGRPVIIVWGGSVKRLWPGMQKFAAHYPQIRLILGGDGAAHEIVKLEHGAVQIQNNVFDLIELDMDSQKIDVVVHRHLEKQPKVKLTVSTSWKPAPRGK